MVSMDNVLDLYFPRWPWEPPGGGEGGRGRRGEGGRGEGGGSSHHLQGPQKTPHDAPGVGGREISSSGSSSI